MNSPMVYLGSLQDFISHLPASRDWTRTRARLDLAELDRPLGHVTVPPALTAEEQRSTG
jgi:hypothetical protein